MKLFKIFTAAAAFLMLFSFSSCSKNKPASGKIQVVASIFPVYDWCRQIIGNTPDIELTLLVKNGTDLHSYQPSVSDIAKIKNADLFIYAGGESDSWVNETVSDDDSESEHHRINLMNLLKNYIVEEEIIEGMEASAEEGENNSDGPEYDEHVWLSVDNALYICQFVKDALINLDSDNAQSYTDNYLSYTSQLSDLKSEYANIFAQYKDKTIIICDRFPFRYLTDEFEIKYYAAFSGCTTDAEAGYKTIAFLADKLSSLNKNTVFRLENSTNRLCDTVIETAKAEDCKIVSLDSMQTTTLEQAQNGKNYLDTMRYNLNCIAEAVK